MLKAKEKSVSALTGGVEYLLKKNKVDYIKGLASFDSPTSIDVELLEGGKTQVQAKNVIIATGSEVTPFPGIEIDEKQIVSSTGVLELEKVPEKLVVIGAGIIGLEMGSVWSRLGANVEVVEFMGAIGGAGMDAEVAKNFQKILGKQGLKFSLNTKVLSAVKKDGKVHIEVEGAKNGKKSTVSSFLFLTFSLFFPSATNSPRSPSVSCSPVILKRSADKIELCETDRSRCRSRFYRSTTRHQGTQPREDRSRSRQPRTYRHRFRVQHLGQGSQVHRRCHFRAHARPQG
jgi:hypothetical protein